MQYQDKSPPRNDETNTCTFLAMKIVDEILSNAVDNPFSPLLTEIAENVIWRFPSAIKLYRNPGDLYDVQEAYQLLDRLGLLRGKYDLTEELPPVPAFSTTGRHALLQATTKLCASDFLSLYTCSPYIFIIGCLGGHPFLLDTHPISEDCGANGNGLLKVYGNSSEATCKCLCHWVLGRLVGKVDHEEMQTLAILRPIVPTSWYLLLSTDRLAFKLFCI